MATGEYASPMSSSFAEFETSARNRRNDRGDSMNSAIRSPVFNTSFSKAGIVTTIFDQILHWFRAQISKRVQYAALSAAVFETILLSAVLVLLTISVWAPFASLTNAIVWFLSPIHWAALFAFISITFLKNFYFLKYFCAVERSKKIDLTQKVSYAVMLVEFCHKLFTTAFLFYFSKSSYSSGFDAVCIAFGCFVSTALAIYHSDFQLRFRLSAVRPFHAINDIFENDIGKEDVELQMKHFTTLSSYSCASVAMFRVFLGPIFVGFSTWLFVFDVSFIYSIFLLSFPQYLFFPYFDKIRNIIIMEGIVFPFPPAFSIHSPTPQQTRTLTNVLESEDKLLKMFAFYDLYKLCIENSERRAEIYSLSQPGGHPRNWRAVSSACVNVLEELESTVTVAAARIVGHSWYDLNDADGAEAEREILMMPQKSRDLAYPMQRNSANTRSLSTSTQKKWLNTLKNFLNPAVVLPRHQAQLTIFAVIALTELVCKSKSEDRYGVVQKDLKAIITLYIDTIHCIESFERVRANVPKKMDRGDATYLRHAHVALKLSLLGIFVAFRQHIGSLGINEARMRAIRRVCNAERVDVEEADQGQEPFDFYND